MAQDAKSRLGTARMGPTPPIGPPGASCGPWRPLWQTSRTPPKPPFQNPSIAGWDCVPAFWDRRTPGNGLAGTCGGSAAPWAAPHVSAANPGTPACSNGRPRLASSTGQPAQTSVRSTAARPPARSLHPPRPPAARPLPAPHASAANPGTPACSIGTPGIRRHWQRGFTAPGGPLSHLASAASPPPPPLPPAPRPHSWPASTPNAPTRPPPTPSASTGWRRSSSSTTLTLPLWRCGRLPAEVR